MSTKIKTAQGALILLIASFLTISKSGYYECRNARGYYVAELRYVGMTFRREHRESYQSMACTMFPNKAWKAAAKEAK